MKFHEQYDFFSWNFMNNMIFFHEISWTIWFFFSWKKVSWTFMKFHEIFHNFTERFSPWKSWKIYTAESGSNLNSISAFVLACHLLTYTKRMYLNTNVCFRVPLVCTPRTLLEWPADNAEITWHLYIQHSWA
jgi:hypothetical protein